MRNILLLFQIFLFLSCREIDVEKNKLRGDDYRLFQGTPVWQLAKAVQDSDVDRIKKLVTKEKLNIDFQESVYGKTLLMVAIANENYKSFKALLEAGANPNIHDSYDGTSAIIMAADLEEPDNIKFLKLLLQYKADPNDIETGERREGNTTRRTPLLNACSDVTAIADPIIKVKLLVEAGANINFRNEFGASPLENASVFDHYDVVLYLLQNGADYKSVLYTEEGKEYYLWDALRFDLYDLDSKEYEEKMKVVDFLKEKGIDYRNTKIPDYAINQAKKWYPENWEEYLSKY